MRKSRAISPVSIAVLSSFSFFLLSCGQGETWMPEGSNIDEHRLTQLSPEECARFGIGENCYLDDLQGTESELYINETGKTTRSSEVELSSEVEISSGPELSSETPLSSNIAPSSQFQSSSSMVVSSEIATSSSSIPVSSVLASSSAPVSSSTPLSSEISSSSTPLSSSSLNPGTGNCYAACVEGQVYTAGMTCSHNGHNWSAKWWVNTLPPGDPWNDLGPCSAGG